MGWCGWQVRHAGPSLQCCTGHLTHGLCCVLLSCVMLYCVLAFALSRSLDFERFGVYIFLSTSRLYVAPPPKKNLQGATKLKATPSCPPHPPLHPTGSRQAQGYTTAGRHLKAANLYKELFTCMATWAQHRRKVLESTGRRTPAGGGTVWGGAGAWRVLSGTERY